MIGGIIIIATDIVIIIAFLIGTGSESHRAFPDLDLSAGADADAGADAGADADADADADAVAGAVADADAGADADADAGAVPSILFISVIMYCKICIVKILLYKTEYAIL